MPKILRKITRNVYEVGVNELIDWLGGGKEEIEKLDDLRINGNKITIITKIEKDIK